MTEFDRCQLFLLKTFFPILVMLAGGFTTPCYRKCLSVKNSPHDRPLYVVDTVSERRVYHIKCPSGHSPPPVNLLPAGRLV